MLLILAFGIVSLFHMQSSLFPKQESEFITVDAAYPGASPGEIEEGIVLKIENNLESISGIEQVTSTSKENSGRVRIEIQDGYDINVLLQEVKNGVDRVSSFPEQMERIVVYKEEPLSPAGQIALKGEDVPLHALKDLAERAEQELLSLEEISQIRIYGYTDPEIEISVKEAELRNYNLSFSDISSAVASENLQATGGLLRKTGKRYIIRADRQDYYAKGLKDIVIRSEPDGGMVKLEDIASVNDTFSEDTQQAYLDGERAIFITVNTTNEEDVLVASKNLKQYIDRFNSRNNNVEAILVDDATTRLTDRISVLKENGLLGLILVLLLLGLMLRIRLAFWVALSIPIAFSGMFLLAIYYGVTINFFSLFGMIIVLGILVDDGIVVAENVYQKYEEGYAPTEAAIQGTLEVAPAIISAVLTTILTFSFFFFIEVRIGDMFSDIAFMVSAALFISVIEVLFILPSHLSHSKALHSEPHSPGFQETISKYIFGFRNRIYLPVLQFSLKHKTLVSLTTIAVLLLTMASISGGIIKTTFFPNLERNDVEVTLQMKQGSTEKKTKEQTEKIVKAADRLNSRYQQDFNMDKSIIRNTETWIGPESNEARIILYLIPSEQRNIRSFKIASDLRKEVGNVPQAEQLSYTKERQIGKPVEISLVSTDFQQLKNAALDVKSQLKQMPELKDIIDNQDADQPEVHISLTDQGKALGFTTAEVMRQVRNAYFGNEVQRLQRGKNEVKVWVRYDMEERQSLEVLRNMRLHNSKGNSYPLSELANLERRMGLVSINHRDGRREIQIEAELANLEVSTPEVLATISSNILGDITQRYPSVQYRFEGQARQTRKVREAALTVLPVLLILIFSIIVLTFGSYSQALVMFILIPFGLIGAAWGHYIHDISFGILSMLGIIALVGIIVNDGLVFVTTFNDKVKKGTSFYDALILTGASRFRPVILTTLTTVAGLSPLIFEKDFQAQFLIPVAVSVAYGLLIATFLLLILLPILLVTLNNLKRLIYWVWNGKWITHDQIISPPEEHSPASE